MRKTADEDDDLPDLIRRVSAQEPAYRRALAAHLTALRDATSLAPLERIVGQLGGGTAGDAAVRSAIPIDAWLADVEPDVIAQAVTAFVVGATVGGEAAGIATKAPHPIFNVVNPEALAWAQQHAATLLVDVGTATMAGVQAAIATAIELGWGAAKTARVIRETISLTQAQSAAVVRFAQRLAEGDADLTDDVLFARVGRYAEAQRRIRALTIARTELAFAASAGQQRLWDLALADGVLPKNAMKKIWLVTRAEIIEPRCEALSNEVVDVSAPFSNGRLGPPDHPNSIAGWVEVEGNTIAATRMLYAGQIREIVTASGRTLAVTPNHSVATARGFVFARDVKEGDHLLSYCERVEDDREPIAAAPPTSSVSAPPQDEQYGPSAIDEVFRSLELAGELVVTERFGDEFHGDAAYGNGDIDVVYVDRELGTCVKSTLANERERLGLKSTESNSPARHLGGRDVSTVGDGISRSDTAVLVQAEMVLASHPPKTRRIGATARLDAVIAEMGDQFRARDASAVRELKDRLAGSMSQDQVVEIRDVDYLGHVYDLQTVSEVIVAEGLVISNCRCAASLIKAPPKALVESSVVITRRPPHLLTATVESAVRDGLADVTAAFDALTTGARVN